MTQQKKAGMQLRQAADPKKQASLWLLQTGAAALAAVVLVLTLTGLTGNPWTVMLPVAAGLCIVCGILLKTGHEDWFYLGTLLAALVLTLVCRQQVLEGFRLFWNQTGDAMVRGRGQVLPAWELQLDTQRSGLYSAVFSGLCGCLISLLCCFLTSFAPGLLAIVLSGSLLMGMTALGAAADLALLLCVPGVSVLLVLYGGWRKKDAVPVMMNWAACAAALCLLLAIVASPDVQGWCEQVRETVHDAIHEHTYETKYTTLPEGDFSNYEKTDRKAAQALAVTMEFPQKMYLRGFTGAAFTGDGWEPLDKAALAENQQLLYWLNLNAFDQNAQFDAAAASAGLEENTVAIQNIGACSFYRYVPFSVGKSTWVKPENLNTDGVYAEGERSYVYSVTGGSTEDIMQVLTQLQSDVTQYRRSESGYRQFIRHYYLQIPDEVKQLLQEDWDEIAAAYGGAANLTAQQGQACALLFFSECFPKEGTPEDMELPLEMAKGTSFQYATVAAMTLRYYGIPARYAEGYVITEEMAAKTESGQTMTVDSSCAKAWVEVYQDGIGWIPMDLTPGIGEILEDPNSTRPSKNNSNKNTTQKQEEKPEEEPEEKPDPTGGSMVLILLKTVLTGVLMALLVLLLIFLLLWLRRKLLLGRKEKKFNTESCSEAVAWIYADTALLLEKLGFDRGNGSMRALTQSLEESYGAEFAAQFAAVSELNDRALFSSICLEEAARQTAREFHSQVLAALKTDVKWYKRLWLKWALCLY